MAESNGSISTGAEGQGREAKGKPRRRVIAWIIVGVGAAAGLTFGVRYYLYALTHVSTDDAFVAGYISYISPRVSGQVVKVLVTDNQWVNAGDMLVELDAEGYAASLASAKGTLEMARATGRASDINIELTEIDATAGVQEAEANVQSAEAAVTTGAAAVAAASSQLEQARAQLASARTSLEEARAEATSAEAQNERDQADLVRNQKMAETETVSQQDLDHATATARISAANLAVARAKVTTGESAVVQAEAGVKAREDVRRQAQAQLLSMQAGVAQAKAKLSAANDAAQRIAYSRSQAAVSSAAVDKAEADMEKARLDLSYTKVVAPIAGHVTEKMVETGMYVQGGQALLAIVPTDVWVVANFKETQLTEMRPGQPVKMTVDAYPDVVFKGHVDSIQRGTGAQFSLLPPQNATGNYIKVVQRVPVKIVFDDAEQVRKYLLAQGMSVVPEVDVSVSGKGAASQASGPGGSEGEAAK